MITYENGKWQLAAHIVKFTHNGEYREVYTINPQYWRDFAERWKDTFTLHEIVDFTPTEEQKMRYENIKNMPEDFGDIYSQYVEFGTIAEHAHLLVSHPFVSLVTRLTEISNHQKIEELRVEMARSNTELFELVLSIGGSPGV